MRAPSKNLFSSTQKVGQLFGSRARMSVMALGSLLPTRTRLRDIRDACTWATCAGLRRALECGRTASSDGGLDKFRRIRYRRRYRRACIAQAGYLAYTDDLALTYLSRYTLRYLPAFCATNDNDISAIFASLLTE